MLLGNDTLTQATKLWEGNGSIWGNYYLWRENHKFFLYHFFSVLFFRIQLDESNDLFFEHVTEDDSGRYVCKAENLAGIARRNYALLVMGE